jgi:nucleoid-associated protein YgaU
MPDTATKIKTDEHGNVLLTKELVKELEPNTVYNIERQGKAIWLEPEAQPQKLHEIIDPEKRLEAFREFVKSFAHKTGVTWPENYDFRNDIYD